MLTANDQELSKSFEMPARDYNIPIQRPLNQTIPNTGIFQLCLLTFDSKGGNPNDFNISDKQHEVVKDKL